MPKIIPSKGFSRGVILFTFSDQRWARITSHIPEALSIEADGRLREAVVRRCMWLRTERLRFDEGASNAKAMRSVGTRQLPPLARLAQALREAADAWKEVRGIHDDYFGNLALFEGLETMAQDAQRRLTAFSKLGKPVVVTNPWPEFVRKVAQCCRDLGLKPTAASNVYDGAKPSWFQKFMAELDKNLLGTKNLLGVRPDRTQYERDHRAFYAEIAKALRANNNTGKAKKQIPRN